MKAHKSLTDAQVAEITAARATWLQWAERERDRAAKGYALHASASTGFRVVAAYDKELATGKPHCSCCQKPLMAMEGIR